MPPKQSPAANQNQQQSDKKLSPYKIDQNLIDTSSKRKQIVIKQRQQLNSIGSRGDRDSGERGSHSRSYSNEKMKYNYLKTINDDLKKLDQGGPPNTDIK